MKIVIVTPALQASAIGRMAAMVSRQLVSDSHDVVVVRAEAAVFLDRVTHDFGAETVPWTESGLVADTLSSADLVVHQIGNSHEFHEGNLAWLDHAPAAVCLHDFYLGHLFHGWAQSHLPEARRALVDWYGDGADDLFFQCANSPDFLELTCDTMPMTEWIASRAASVIIHSSWGAQRVLDGCSGPVWTVPMAYDIASGTHAPDYHPAKTADEIGLLTVGHVNPNKRIASVLRAIGASDVLRERITYRVLGRVEASVMLSLTSLARRLDVRLILSGEVDDAVLADAFIDADIVSCLRSPSLESASASAIESMLHGKPTLVTDIAFYREIPDDCVLKVGVDDEEREIREALEYLCANPAIAKEMGGRARVWASEMFSAAHYAKRLVDIAPATQGATWLLNGSRPFARYLSEWGGMPSLLSSVQVTAPLDIMAG